LAKKRQRGSSMAQDAVGPRGGGGTPEYKPNESNIFVVVDHVLP
jgi:hypothetical protein